MGQRTLKRVPLGFDWPLNEVWGGYLMPSNLDEKLCEPCDGSGCSPHARRLNDRWYGQVPFNPTETGSAVLTVETPEVRAFAERNIGSTPEFYGSGEAAIVREAQRLATMWNDRWCHHLDQDDVDALVDGGRLWEFTRRFVKGDGWQKIEPFPVVTAVEVNRWSLAGFGHDSINASVVVAAKCERDGQPVTCDLCEGHGSVERYPGQRAEAEAWESTEPPSGVGWQLWETTSEGSPVSPVFETAEGLAAWCVTGASRFAGERSTYGEWLAMFQTDEVDVGSTMFVAR